MCANTRMRTISIVCANCRMKTIYIVCAHTRIRTIVIVCENTSMRTISVVCANTRIIHIPIVCVNNRIRPIPIVCACTQTRVFIICSCVWAADSSCPYQDPIAESFKVCKVDAHSTTYRPCPRRLAPNSLPQEQRRRVCTFSALKCRL